MPLREICVVYVLTAGRELLTRLIVIVTYIAPKFLDDGALFAGLLANAEHLVQYSL